MQPKSQPNRLTEYFDEPISVYTRAQAIADGVLVDVSRAIDPSPFKCHVAMTRGAYAATIEAGGVWEDDPDCPDQERLVLPAGQDTQGRMWDVFHMLLVAIRSCTGGQDLQLKVSVFDGRKRNTVELWSRCGPGDAGEAVITIMLRGED